jgi:hypothetical protein
MSMEESRVLIWHRDKLKFAIMAEPFLQAVFDHILGRDVVKKLMQVTQVSMKVWTLLGISKIRVTQGVMQLPVNYASIDI